MTHFLLFHHLLLACRSFPGIMQQSINCSNCSCFNAASKLTARIIFIKHRCGSTYTVHVHCTHLLVHARIPSPDTSGGNMRRVGLQGRQESTSSAPRGRNHSAPHFHTKPEMGMLIRKTPVLKLYADQIKLSVGALSKAKIVCNLWPKKSSSVIMGLCKFLSLSGFTQATGSNAQDYLLIIPSQETTHPLPGIGSTYW